jgi:hypothetical protein
MTNNEVTQGTTDIDTHKRRGGRRYKPQPIGDILGEKFNVEQMGPSLMRGMVLSIYKAKVLEAAASRASATGESKKKLSDRAKKLLADFQGAKLIPDDGPGFDHPSLYIYVRQGSLWRQELHYQRLQVKTLINERLKCDFLKDVRVKYPRMNAD